jgi:hypothetical protein
METPAHSYLLVTAPTDEERRYYMSVQVGLRCMPGLQLLPWLQITANCLTGEIGCAAGIRCTRTHEEDDSA